MAERCNVIDPETHLRCDRLAGHEYPAHSHTKNGGAWYLEWARKPEDES